MTTVDAVVVDGEATVDRAASIAEQAAAVDLTAVRRKMSTALATVVVGVLWFLGWVPGQVTNGIVYLCVAVRQGWRDARPTRPPAPAPVQARTVDRTVRP